MIQIWGERMEEPGKEIDSVDFKALLAQFPEEDIETEETPAEAGKAEDAVPKRRSRKMLPIILLAAVIAVACAAVAWFGRKQVNTEPVTYTIYGYAHNGSFEKTVRITADKDPYLLAEDDWEKNFSEVYWSNDSEYLTITLSVFPKTEIRFTPELSLTSACRMNVSVTEKGKSLFDFELDSLYLSEDYYDGLGDGWSDGWFVSGSLEESDSIWFYDMNGDGYPELLAVTGGYGRQRIRAYDIKNRKQYAYDNIVDSYYCGIESGSLVMLASLRDETAVGYAEEQETVKGSFLIKGDKLVLENWRPEESFDKIPVLQGNPKEACCWFDEPDADATEIQMIRLPEMPETAYVLEKDRLYIMSSDWNILKWIPYSMQCAYFTDIDGDGVREMVMGIDMRNGEYYMMVLTATGKLVDAEYGVPMIRDGKLIVQYEKDGMMGNLTFCDLTDYEVMSILDVDNTVPFSWSYYSMKLKLPTVPGYQLEGDAGGIYRIDENGVREPVVALGEGKLITHTYIADMDNDGVQDILVGMKAFDYEYLDPDYYSSSIDIAQRFEDKNTYVVYNPITLQQLAVYEGNCWISYDPERECFVFGDPDYVEEPLVEVIIRDGKLVSADE